jgi:phosphoribosylformimino-5-aminoimidazole carboxamide ribotide isomerase
VKSVIEAGADRAILGTAAVSDPSLVEQACERFPGRIAVGIDQRSGRVATAGWLAESSLEPSDVVRRLAAAGVAAIIFTDIARDGTGAGANLEATLAFAAGHNVPVIVSGGVASLEDIRRTRAAFDGGENLSGVIIGRALYDGTIRLADAVAVARGVP